MLQKRELCLSPVTHGILQVAKPLSAKMASEAGKEEPINEQNTHSRLIFQAFLKKECLPLSATEIVRTHCTTYMGNLRQGKGG